MRALRVLISAGGTREPIDAARVIANTSTGRLGALIAETARTAGHDVLLLAGVHAARPRDVRCLVFDSSADLWQLLQEHVPAADVVVHAAAVSDYVPVRAPGKLSSDAPELLLRLQRAPKLVDRLRELCPRGVLVGFKLTSGLPEAGQVAAAEALRTRARLDLVVANDTAATGEENHEALFVEATGAPARCRGKPAIAARLVRWIEERVQAAAGQSA